MASIAVDDTNRPVVVFEAPLNQPVTFVDLVDGGVSSSSGLIVAGFDEALQLRWVGPLVSTEALRSNSATFASGQLVVELQCPAATVDLAVGAICGKNIASVAAKLKLPP